jgi:hypothetical protein
VWAETTEVSSLCCYLSSERAGERKDGGWQVEPCGHRSVPASKLESKHLYEISSLSALKRSI